MNLPKRHKNHKTSTDSLNCIRNILGGDYACREQDNDYGVDMLIERFGDEVTGDVFFVQVKGTEEIFIEPVRIKNFPTKTLNYSLLFSVPFFLFYTSTTSKITKYIWLQKYYDYELRGKKGVLDEQKTITIEFPEENDLEKNKEKITEIIEFEKKIKRNHYFIIHYARFKKFYKNLKDRNGDASISAKVCLNCLSSIKDLGILECSDDSLAKIMEFDYETVSMILYVIMRSNFLADCNIKAIDNLLLPLDFIEGSVLNTDLYDNINDWLGRRKPF